MADLAVRHAFWPTDVIARQPFQITLSVTNQGPYAALDVSVTNTLPAWTSVLATQAAQGTTTTSAGKLIFALGTIPANSTVGLSISLRATNALATYLTNQASVSSAFPDPDLADNITSSLISARADLDRDGMPDDWELAHGLNPNDPADALLDADVDGTSNLLEYLAGTNPRDPKSKLALSLRVAGKNALVNWQSGTNATHYLQRLRLLGRSNFWQNIQTNPAPTPTSGSYTDPLGPDEMQFYRLRLDK